MVCVAVVQLNFLIAEMNVELLVCSYSSRPVHCLLNLSIFMCWNEDGCNVAVICDGECV